MAVPEIHLDEATRLDVNLRELQTLLDAGQIREARALVKTAAEQYPDSELAHRLKRKLASALIRPRPDLPTTSHRREHKWLEQHAISYPGQWLAVLGDQLIAADPKLSVVRAKLRETPAGEHVLLHFQPGDKE